MLWDRCGDIVLHLLKGVRNVIDIVPKMRSEPDLVQTDFDELVLVVVEHHSLPLQKKA